jgi:hypothetical protein
MITELLVTTELFYPYRVEKLRQDRSFRDHEALVAVIRSPGRRDPGMGLGAARLLLLSAD